MRKRDVLDLMPQQNYNCKLDFRTNAQTPEKADKLFNLTHIFIQHPVPTSTVVLSPELKHFLPHAFLNGTNCS